jgi:uncharacterized membrane protein
MADTVGTASSADIAQLEVAELIDADLPQTPPEVQPTSFTAMEDERTESAIGATTNRSGGRPEDIVTHTAMKLNSAAVASAAFRARELELKPAKIAIEVAATLRALLYGAPAPDSKKNTIRAFNEEWLQQGLFFPKKWDLSTG